MAIRTKSEYSGLYLTTGESWPDNTTGDISASDLRDGIGDLFDSQTSNW